MLICAACGYAGQLKLFALIAAIGIVGNAVWMRLALGFSPISGNALMAHVSAMLFALSSCGFGWILGRFIRQWHESRVEE
ncbi:hypothetical protein C1J03_08300 [Sulfitobacter sp. SK012]|nr:hypothetical protein C1J03_08300 [Sulfitobacter sp. SK012]